MLSTVKDIYKKCEEPEFVESVGNFFFKNIADATREVPNLIINAGPLGNFFYRKAKTTVHALKLSDLSTPEYTEFIYKILDLYEAYDAAKLKFKYEKFGKESHDAYLLVKDERQRKIFKRNKFSDNS